tara:strand:- start:31 stop:594 length:564 start_codon:yes stop_codon:yes gene_type:complete
MYPIPYPLLETRVFTGLLNEGRIAEDMWDYLKYMCKPEVFESLIELQESVLELDLSDLPQLEGTNRQIHWATSIREMALRTEVIMQKVLVNSKVIQYNLFPGIRENPDSKFWVENNEELSRQFKVEHPLKKSLFIPVPKDVPTTSKGKSTGRLSIWQATLLDYTWEIDDPIFDSYRERRKRYSIMPV